MKGRYRRVHITVSAAFIASSLAYACNAAGTPDKQDEGVTVEAHALKGEVVLCIGAKPGHKVSAQYGVEISAEPPDPGVWNETLPKLVSNEDLQYFPSPLKIPLHSRGDPQGRTLSVKLGACFKKDYCKLYDLHVRVPDGAVEQAETDCH